METYKNYSDALFDDFTVPEDQVVTLEVAEVPKTEETIEVCVVFFGNIIKN